MEEAKCIADETKYLTKKQNTKSQKPTPNYWS